MNGAYKNPPLREAIFDVRLRFPITPDSKVFDKVHESIKDDYPKRQLNNLQRLSFSLGASDAASSVQSTVVSGGIRCTSSDGTTIAQFRSDGFTLNKLKPYNGWESFYKEARRLLDLYVKTSPADYAERVALRYINAISIPETNFEIGDYFATSPRIPESLPQDISAFFLRCVLKDDKSESLAIVNQTTEETDRIEATSVIFDLDVFQANLRLDIRSHEFHVILNELKQFRTRIFEESLTAKAKKLFA